MSEKNASDLLKYLEKYGDSATAQPAGSAQFDPQIKNLLFEAY